MLASLTLAQRKNHHLADFMAQALFNSIINVMVKAQHQAHRVLNNTNNCET